MLCNDRFLGRRLRRSWLRFRQFRGSEEVLGNQQYSGGHHYIAIAIVRFYLLEASTLNLFLRDYGLGSGIKLDI